MTDNAKTSPHICIIAGEPSGDALGASLIRALKQAAPDTVITGIGGAKMAAEGLSSLFAIDELAVMGIVEVVPKIPHILQLIDRAAAHVEAVRPDIVVTIDSPDFCFRVQKKIRAKMGAEAPKLIHYVAPSVWAWREGRAKKIAKFLDGLICLFDFEPPYFEREGLRATAVGHPAVENNTGPGDSDAFRNKYGIPADARTIGIFMGSRRGELQRHGPLFRDVMAMMPGGTHFILPTLPHLVESVRSIVDGFDERTVITADPEDKRNAFAACDTALAVSGTVGLELAVARIPHAIAYRMNPMTYEIGKRLVKTRYAHLTNILLDEGVVPEFIQHDCTVENISAGLYPLITDAGVRQAQHAAFDVFARRIGEGDEKTPSQKAAAFIRSFI